MRHVNSRMSVIHFGGSEECFLVPIPRINVATKTITFFLYGFSRSFVFGRLIIFWLYNKEMNQFDLNLDNSANNKMIIINIKNGSPI